MRQIDAASGIGSRSRKDSVITTKKKKRRKKMVKPEKTIRTVDLETGETMDLDIIRIFTKLTKVNDHVMKGEGINVSWAEFDDPKLLDDALDAFMDFIIKSKDRRMALMHAVERAERRAESKIKASSDMVN